MSKTNKVKTSKTTRDMGLFVPSLALNKLHNETTVAIKDNDINACDVIIKMNECIVNLETAINIMSSDLTKLPTKVEQLERLRCIQTVTAKVNSINELFKRLHNGESAVTIANDFTELTNIQI